MIRTRAPQAIKAGANREALTNLAGPPFPKMA